MSKELIGLIGIILLFVFLAARTWIGVAMTLIGMIGVMIIRGETQALSVVGTQPFITTNNYTLTVIPMFVLMGLVISESRMGSDLFTSANAFLGHHRGGLASATTVASGILGAITGSHMAGTIIMSKIALPEMKRYNYADELACGSVAGAAPLAIIIPPSVPMIMYGIIADENIGRLFISGIVPGIILVVLDVIFISVATRLKPDYGPAGDRTPWIDRIKTLKTIWPIVLLFLLVLGGIYGGWFTVTESGAIGAFAAVVIGLIARRLNFRKIVKCLVNTALLTGTILLLMIGTNIFTTFITYSKVPSFLANAVVSSGLPVEVIILLVAIMYIVLGMFMPDNPMIMLTVPILYPIMVTTLHLNGTWFGLFVVLMTALGSITPPVGMVVFLLSGLTKVDVRKIFRGVIPFIAGLIIVIILISLFPGIVLWLPGLM